MKKTVKKKGPTVQTNDHSAHEASQPEHAHVQDSKEKLEEETASAQPQEETIQTDSQDQSSLPVDRMAAHQPDTREDLLGEFVVSHTSEDQLKVNI